MAAIVKPCIDDTTYIAAAIGQGLAVVAEATVQSLVQKALFEWRRYSTGIISDMRQELADRRMVMAEATLAHAAAGWAEEKSFVNETMGMANPSADYNTMAAADAAVERAWQEVDSGLDSALFKFGLPLSACTDARTAQAMALGKTDILSHTMRSAEAREIALDDVRFSRQNAVLGLGRGIFENARSMGELGGYRDAIRQSLIGTVNSAVSLFGYATTRWIKGAGYTSQQQGIPRVLQRDFAQAGYQPVDVSAGSGQQINIEVAPVMNNSAGETDSSNLA